MGEHCKLRECRNTRASGQGTKNAESQGPGSVSVRTSVREMRARVWKRMQWREVGSEHIDVWGNRIKGGN